MSNHLLRSHAPISDDAWDAIDEEARERLVAALVGPQARRLLRPERLDATRRRTSAAPSRSPRRRATASQGLRRRVLALAEVRAPFTVSREELRAGDRGAEDVDFAALDQAARNMAVAENKAVFHGWSEAGFEGITEASPHSVVRGDDFDGYPSHVAKAVELLLQSGIAGPYGLALGTEDYTAVVETAEHGGYPLFDHLRQILGGPIAWSPGVVGGVVLSQRGGDFLFESGQDLVVGYDHYDADAVHLYIEQSFSFRVATPEAAAAIIPA